jgi:GNAT superfamily N-acetyltransferase
MHSPESQNNRHQERPSDIRASSTPAPSTPAVSENFFEATIDKSTHINLRAAFKRDPQNALAVFVDYYSAFSAAFPNPVERPTFNRLLQRLEDPNSPLEIFLFLEDSRIVGGRQFKFINYQTDPFGIGEFTWVTAEARRLGVGSKIIKTTEDFLRSRNCKVILGEFHDPNLCSAEDRALDEKVGITPESRLRFWERQGYQVLDAPYIIPPIAGQNSWVTNCLLGVKSLQPSHPPSPISKDDYLRMLHCYWDTFSEGYRTHNEYGEFLRQFDKITVINPIPVERKRSHLQL